MSHDDLIMSVKSLMPGGIDLAEAVLFKLDITDKPVAHHTMAFN
jgi:hypothetical protein